MTSPLEVTSNPDNQEQEETETPTNNQQEQLVNQAVNYLQITRNLQNSNGKHKTFVVKIQNVAAIDATTQQNQNQNILDPVQVIESSLGDALLPSDNLRLAKVYDNLNTNSLNQLSNELKMRKQFVDQLQSNKHVVRCFGAAFYSQEMAFVDSDGLIHEYQSGYSLMLYDYCSQGNILNLALNKQINDQDYQSLIRSMLAALINFLNLLLIKTGISLLNLNLKKVLIGREKQLQVCDFTNAKDLQSKIQQSDFQSQLNDKVLKIYLAPEILSNSTFIIGEKVDVFSLGVMLFVLLFKGYPFGSAQNNDPYYKYFYESDEKLDIFFRVHPNTKSSPVNKELKLLIKGMLNPDYLKRFSFNQILMNSQMSCFINNKDDVSTQSSI